MIAITKIERRNLEKVGLLQYRRKLKGGGFQDSNFAVVNKFHKKRNKHYYIVETPEVLAFLGRFDKLNYQKITQAQLEILKKDCHVTDDLIQVYGEYKPNATVFVDQFNVIYCKKITGYMLTMGIWKK